MNYPGSAAPSPDGSVIAVRPVEAGYKVRDNEGFANLILEIVF